MARPAPGADRSVAVLDLLAEHPDERFTLSEVARRCGLNKATAHALLSALTAHGILLRHPDEKRYSLGPRLIAIGDAAHYGYTAVDFAPHILGRLAQETGLRVSATHLEDDEAISTMARAGTDDEPPPPRLPHIPPLGALFMAWADEPSVEAWLARAPASDVVGHVLQALPAIRRRGYAVTRATRDRQRLMGPAAAELTHDDVRSLLADFGRHGALITDIEQGGLYHVASVAAPVFRADGSVELALNVSAPIGREGGLALSGDEVVSLANRVVAAANELTEAVHGHQPMWSTA